MSEHYYRMRQIFAGHDACRATNFFHGGKKLAHYTSVANAVNILRTRQVWLRNVRAMNDLLEVHHGFNLLEAALAAPTESPFEPGLCALNNAVDQIHSGLSQEAVAQFESLSFQLRHQTFATCLSEHDTVEDQFGRLSMWRSYASSQVGVAIVINPQALQQLVTHFGVFASPVHYLKQGPMNQMMLAIAANVRGAAEYLRNVSRVEVQSWQFHLLRSIATCSKHPGFREEQEWRIMHTHGVDETSPLEEAVEMVGGIPQIVMKLALKDYSDRGVFGLTVPSLVEQVIVGPCQYPWVICDALSSEMENAGIADARSKIIVSEIPLRT